MLETVPLFDGLSPEALAKIESRAVARNYPRNAVVISEGDEATSMFIIVTGSVKPKEIVETFGVPMVTVKRYVKVYRQHGVKGFYESKPRHSSASKLKGEVLARAQRLLDEGRSVGEVGERDRGAGQHHS